MISSNIDEREKQFFDAQDTAPSVSDSCSKFYNSVGNGLGYDVWARTPTSVQDRKKQFLKLLIDDEDDDDDLGNRIIDTSDAVLSSPVYEELSSISSSSSSVSDSSRICVSREGIICNSSCKEEDSLTRNKIDSSPPPPLVQKLVERQIKVAGTMARTMSRVKSQWLSRLLRSMTCVVDSQGRVDDRPCSRTRVRRVKVHQNKKQLKELSAVFIGQDIEAHQGSILTMKFSQNGRYLATSGEDGVVRIWEVVEDDRSNDIDIPDIDPCCIYFTLNHLSQLSPLTAENQKLSMLKSLKKTSDSACVIVPPKVFRIREKPVHEFHGHKGEVLDLSWSSDHNLLLSSSVDQTVCLWSVGNNQCIKVFPHSNYVTCVQFNPVDDSYFISGSIDGKVRIWSIGSSQVVDWSDIREIVTAVTYNPDGKGGIIGSMTGCCRFFSLSDHRFQLEASVCLNSKKKWPCRRIIGFQFYPQDASRVMVTCADSHVLILHGINVICKYKGQRNGGNQLYASFTSDGKHIVSACEDSNVYVWNCNTELKKTVKSFECFSSESAASVVLPWSGLMKDGWKLVQKDSSCSPSSSSSSSSYFYLAGQDLFLESIIPKGSATWPEEKLLSTTWDEVALCKSRYKFLKTSCETSSSCNSSWGLVIVTAGWDGHIRSFLNYGLPVT